MRKLWEAYHHRYMIRPTLYRTAAKCAVVAVLALLWSRFVDHGILGLPVGLEALGLLCMALAWFSYLRLDGMTIHFFLENKQKKKKTRVRAADIADFVDEPIVPYSDLPEDGRIACRLVSSLLTGLIFVIASLVLRYA